MMSEKETDTEKMGGEEREKLTKGCGKARHWEKCGDAEKERE